MKNTIYLEEKYVRQKNVSTNGPRHATSICERKTAVDFVRQHCLYTLVHWPLLLERAGH
jgi:hypothetical protein